MSDAPVPVCTRCDEAASDSIDAIHRADVAMHDAAASYAARLVAERARSEALRAAARAYFDAVEELERRELLLRQARAQRDLWGDVLLARAVVAATRAALRDASDAVARGWA